MNSIEDGESHRPARHKNEDTSPTTERELRGWYSYSIAAEVFAVCGVGSFLPVTLEQLAKERGVRRSDGVTPCVAPPSTASDGPAMLVRLLRRAVEEQQQQQDESQCIIMPFGKPISTASFAMYTFSAAVLVQALVLISFSSVADYGTYRKRLLLAFAYVGSVACMLFIIVAPSIYLLGSALVVVGVVCLGSSFVLLNSFLPLLAANHPSITNNGTDETSTSSADNDDEHDSTNEAGAPKPKDDKTSSPVLALSTKISSNGVGLGYLAAVFMQVLSILLLITLNKITTFSSGSTPLRLVLFFVGLWWALFTIPTSLWLRDRAGPPLPSSSNNASTSIIRQIWTYTTFAWRSVYRTLRLALKLKDLSLFLLAWFLLSDAIATVSGTAILFARTELGMSTVPIAFLSITVTTSGILGAFVWPLLSRRYNLRTHSTIIACVCLMQTIPIYGLLGYLPPIQTLGWGGLQQPWEIYPLGVVYGFVMGGLSSYCRSFYGQLIPPGSEAAFYALYAITDKGSSAVGPAVTGAIVDRVGSIRPAFGFLAVLIAAPVPLIWVLKPERGRKDAVALAERLRDGGEGGSRRVRGRDAEEDGEVAMGLLNRSV